MASPATHICTAAARSGRRPPTTPTLASCTSRPGMRGRTGRRRPAGRRRVDGGDHGDRGGDGQVQVGVPAGAPPDVLGLRRGEHHAVLFNASDGRKGVAQAGKTAGSTCSTRETGEPLLRDRREARPAGSRSSTPRRPSRSRATAVHPARTCSAERGRADQEVVHAADEGAQDRSGAGDLHRPRPREVGPRSCRAPGRRELEPDQLQPRNEPLLHLLLPCATTGGDVDSGAQWKRGEYYIWQFYAGAAYTESWGTFTAIDALSGRRVWQKRFPEACYSGTRPTKGNLVFLGRTTASSRRTTREREAALELPEQGAGANDTASFFERKDRVRRVPVAGRRHRGLAARRRAVALQCSTAPSARRKPRAAARGASTAAKAKASRRARSRATLRRRIGFRSQLLRLPQGETAPAATSGPDLSDVTSLPGDDPRAGHQRR